MLCCSSHGGTSLLVVPTTQFVRILARECSSPLFIFGVPGFTASGKNALPNGSWFLLSHKNPLTAHAALCDRCWLVHRAMKRRKRRVLSIGSSTSSASKVLPRVIAMAVCVSLFLSLYDLNNHQNDDNHASANLPHNVKRWNWARRKKPGQKSSLQQPREGESCLRFVMHVHKMGYAVVRKLFDGFPGIKPVTLPDELHKNFEERSTYYRYAVVSRNWYDALISGYLYHKSGHECWKNENGGAMAGRRVRYKGWLLNYNWEKRLAAAGAAADPTVGGVTTITPWWRPARGRNLCTYLSEESEEDGLRVYTEFALRKWYRNLLEARKLASATDSFSRNRTLFVCYEQLTNPATQAQTVREILDWMYRSGCGNDNGQRELFVAADNNNAAHYSGGHATSHDPMLRGRLRSLIQSLDERFFHHEIAAANAEFGCVSSQL